MSSSNAVSVVHRRKTVRTEACPVVKEGQFQGERLMRATQPLICPCSLPCYPEGSFFAAYSVGDTILKTIVGSQSSGEVPGAFRDLKTLVFILDILFNIYRILQDGNVTEEWFVALRQP